MDDIGPFTFNSVRFFVGFLAIIPLALLFEARNLKKEFRLDKKTFIILSFLIGFGNAGMLRLLAHLLSEDPVRSKRLRSASFQAVAVLWDGQELHVGKGICRGSIAYEIGGEGGFGYDPIFIPADLDDQGEPLDPEMLGSVSTHGKTFGAVAAELKHRFSHRRRALDDILEQVQHLVNR